MATSPKYRMLATLRVDSVVQEHSVKTGMLMVHAVKHIKNVHNVIFTVI